MTLCDSGKAQSICFLVSVPSLELALWNFLNLPILGYSFTHALGETFLLQNQTKEWHFHTKESSNKLINACVNPNIIDFENLTLEVEEKSSTQRALNCLAKNSQLLIADLYKHFNDYNNYKYSYSLWHQAKDSRHYPSKPLGFALVERNYFIKERFQISWTFLYEPFVLYKFNLNLNHYLFGV